MPPRRLVRVGVRQTGEEQSGSGYASRIHAGPGDGDGPPVVPGLRSGTGDVASTVSAGRN
jgi:hypothetical protein